MFRAKTVFVIGAGASVEVNLPMGPELLNTIVSLTDIKFEIGRQKSGDHLILEALKILLDEGHGVDKLNAHIKAGWQLGESATQALSIDNVIDALENPEVELMGKLGIVRAILTAESSSRFFHRKDVMPEALDLSKFNKPWYGSFTKLITENIRKSQLDSIFDNIEIINFNYDRCLDHYLPFSIGAYYGVGPEPIRQLMDKLVVHRPYGVAGRLPWQKGNGPSVNFGECSANSLANIAQQVRTFTERVEEGEQLAAMKNAIASADRIVFLGFAFHRQNVELLSTKMQDHAEILATSYGISDSDQSVIESELEAAFGHEFMMNDKRITLANVTCSELFQQYWRTLTAAPGDHEPYSNPFINSSATEPSDFGMPLIRRD